ncbi:MAG TPA: permease-like cell division protein FtsX [Solirubrobacterales bacterium]|nr:permease-like cell division protein FtsX [Solirubrobacterales bacterium]
MSRIVFFFQEAFRALRRNGAPTLAAIVTTVVTVTLLGVLIPIFQTTQAKSDEVRSELNIQVGLYDDATPAERQQLQGELEALPHVESVAYISKAEALATLRSEMKDKSIVDSLNTNPLPSSFEIKADDPANLKTIETAIIPAGANGQPDPVSPIVNNIFDRQQASEEIEQVTSALKIVLTVITALLIVASLMLIGNTIRLSIYTRRREVEVMRLVGATRWFIRWPFMIEGLVVGFAGGLVAILVLWLGKLTIVDPLKGGDFDFLSAQDTMSFPLLVGILFVAAVLVSTIGSGITLRRFLKV